MSDQRARFPLQGASNAMVLEALQRLQVNDVPAHGARNFRAVYYVDDETLDLVNLASTAVAEINAAYAGSSFPSIKEIERELVDIGLDLLQAQAGAGGAVTTGGTESNFMAVKTARDYFRQRRPQQQQPFEIVLAHTGHASLEKAAHMLGLTTRRVHHSVDFHADPAAMEALINEHSIMMVGSAPPAPYATTDPIAELSEIAARHGLWFHVDACMGGFFLPFARELGAPIPQFDFSVPGVWSVSADLHKFGYSPNSRKLPPRCAGKGGCRHRAVPLTCVRKIRSRGLAPGGSGRSPALLTRRQARTATMARHAPTTINADTGDAASRTQPMAAGHKLRSAPSCRDPRAAGHGSGT